MRDKKEDDWTTSLQPMTDRFRALYKKCDYKVDMYFKSVC